MSLQAKGGKGRKRGPSPLSQEEALQIPEFPAGELHPSLEETRMWAGRDVGSKKWLDEEPRREAFSVLSPSCPGSWGRGAHLLGGAGHTLQALQSPLDIPHALLQCSHCPHQPRVQFLGPGQTAFQPLCREQTHEEEDSGGNSARGRLVAGWGRPRKELRVGHSPLDHM